MQTKYFNYGILDSVHLTNRVVSYHILYKQYTIQKIITIYLIMSIQTLWHSVKLNKWEDQPSSTVLENVQVPCSHETSCTIQ